jgi:membrane fusion protein (multidrug efflux system)
MIRVLHTFTMPAVFLAALSLAILSCSGEQKQREQHRAEAAVKVMVIKPVDTEVVKTYTGTLEGIRQAVISAKIAEAVEAVHVQEGETVKEGQVLITLDKSGPSSRYQEALSVYRNAEKNYKKMEYLFREGAVSESQFDAAKTQYEVAKANFEAAASLVEIQSPIEGTVTSLEVSPGDYLHPGQVLATVASTDSLRVKFSVSAADVKNIIPGTPVVISEQETGQEAAGTVVSVSRSADPGTRAFEVEAVMDNSSSRFHPGMFARIKVAVQRLAGVLAVPRRAVLARSDGEAVFVVSCGKASERKVTTGVDLGGKVVVTLGLTEGDSLVTLGQNYLQDGMPVKITEILADDR